MINFLSREDAESGFGHAQSEYGAQFCTKVATIGYFNEVREWSKNSSTARAIIKYVEEADEVINFIGMHGGFQCFDESADNRLSKKSEPTIYIDLLGKLSVYVRKPHENILSRKQTPHASMSSFNNRIALLHELGHAKQFIERPDWYHFYASAKKKSDFREELETKAKEMWTKKLSTPKPADPSLATKSGSAGSSGGKPPVPGKTPATGGAPPPPGPPGAPGGLNAMKQVQAILPKTTEKAQSQSWFVVIDIDNMQRHEWPICTEMGLPIRMHYTDLSA